jgi:hypothetical protein
VDRASACGAEGRRFESYRARHFPDFFLGYRYVFLWDKEDPLTARTQAGMFQALGSGYILRCILDNLQKPREHPLQLRFAHTNQPLGANVPCIGDSRFTQNPEVVANRGLGRIAAKRFTGRLAFHQKLSDDLQSTRISQCAQHILQLDLVKAGLPDFVHCSIIMEHYCEK